MAMAFVLAASAVANAKESRRVVLPYAATLAGSHLASGSYDVKWETHPPAATVTFLHGSKVVATAEGKVVDRGAKYTTNEVVYSQTADGARVIQELRFRNSSEVVVFNE
jgi:hypothetical protein